MASDHQAVKRNTQTQQNPNQLNSMQQLYEPFEISDEAKTLKQVVFID